MSISEIQRKNNNTSRYTTLLISLHTGTFFCVKVSEHCGNSAHISDCDFKTRIEYLVPHLKETFLQICDLYFNMSSLVADAIQVELGASERWPDDVALYQPYQVEQVTLPDYSNCLAVRTFLNMCGLNYDLQLRTNAEEMSPSGRVPFMKIGSFLFSEFDPIVAHLNTRGFSLSSDLSETQKSEMTAYITMVHSILYNAELYVSWIVNEIYSSTTKPRYGSVHPWPLNWVLPWKRQLEVRARLNANGWENKTIEDVEDEIKACLQALSDRLEKNIYFLGDKPTELDALVFGHLYNLITFQLPDSKITDIIKQFKNLADFCSRVEEKYYIEITE